MNECVNMSVCPAPCCDELVSHPGCILTSHLMFTYSEQDKEHSQSDTNGEAFTQIAHVTHQTYNIAYLNRFNQ